MRRGDVTRRTEAHTITSSDVHRRYDQRTHDEDRRRSVGTTTRCELGARSASPVSALREPSRRCDEHKTSAADRISPESVRRTGAATPVRAAPWDPKATTVIPKGKQTVS